MDPGSFLAALLAVHLGAVATPGPNTLLVTNIAAAGQRRAALWAAAGTGAGALIWVVATLGVAQRICKHMATLAVLDGESRRFGFTVSIGLASLAENDRNPEDLLAPADAALYRAKRGGRNRVDGSGPLDRDAA